MRLLTQIDLASYIEYTTRGTWKRAAHLEALCTALERIDSGDLTRLIVTMPPRHGKSEIISKSFPAWYLGRHPDNEVIISCYGAELATDFSRITREKVREFGPAIFGVTLSDESASVGRWGIEGHRGGLVAAGVNGPLTGRGAHLAIIDDPVKSAAEANSQTYRAHTLEWYQTVLRTRLAPSGAIVLVQTRWHKDDLAGWLIQQMNAGGEEWTVINMPAVAGPADALGRAPGDALWPDRFDADALQAIRATLTPYQWSALYQQEPTDCDMALWRYETIAAARVHTSPELRRIVVAVDPAVTASAASDETGIIVGGIDHNDHIYVLADKSLIGTPLEWARTVVAAYKDYGADRVIAEVNQGGDLVEANIRMVDKTLPYKAVRATRGKRIRAEPVAALYEQGRVHHIGRFPQLEDQLCTWSPLSDDSPDRLDALVWLCTELTDKTPAYQKPIVFTR